MQVETINVTEDVAGLIATAIELIEEPDGEDQPWFIYQFNVFNEHKITLFGKQWLVIYELNGKVRQYANSGKCSIDWDWHSVTIGNKDDETDITAVYPDSELTELLNNLMF